MAKGSVTNPIPKYALLEIERRCLVRAELLPDLRALPCVTVEDRYLEAGRMRLRKITRGSECTFKLCKKYGLTGPGVEPIVNVYLTVDEYESFLHLPGCDIVKRRYRYDYLGVRFSIDEFLGALAGLFLCECEAASVEALNAIAFPPFAGDEVTGNPDYFGANLARR